LELVKILNNTLCFFFLSRLLKKYMILSMSRPYNPNDRINPNAQLDPQTGMTRHGGGGGAKSVEQ
jgi:hypothetical protein